MITFTPEYWSMSLYMGGLIHGRAYIRAENIVKDKGGLIHGGAEIILGRAYIRNSTVWEQLLIYCIMSVFLTTSFDVKFM
jgi:hypothetical protein